MEEQAGVEIEESVERENETSSGSKAAGAAARCVHCFGGMVYDKLPRFSRGFGMLVLILGLLLSFLMSLLLGLPMVVIGAYMTGASRAVWRCPNCGALADRSRI